MLPIDPIEMLEELDKHIVGQEDAKKKLVKTLLFNFQRLLLDEEERKKIRKKNILLMGPTGSGKTEIARKLSEILGLPFCRVSATSITMTGFKGDDPSDIISVYLLNEVKANFDKYLRNYIKIEAARKAMQRLKDEGDFQRFYEERKRIKEEQKRLNSENANEENYDERREIQEEELYFELSKVDLSDLELGMEELIDEEDFNETNEEITKITDDDLRELECFDFGSNEREKPGKIDLLTKFRNYYEEEIRKLEELIEKGRISRTSKKWLKLLMESAVIFIDEFDKLFSASREKYVREFYLGVQKHLLTIVEGCNIILEKDRDFQVDTTNMTFIGAGTFEGVESEDLISELKGRFPVCIQIRKLNFKDYLTMVKRNDGGIEYLRTLFPECDISITDSALREIAKWCDELNRKEYLGARRLDEIEQMIHEYVTDLILLKKKNSIKITKKIVTSLLKKHTEKSLFDKEDNSVSIRIGFV